MDEGGEVTDQTRRSDGGEGRSNEKNCRSLGDIGAESVMLWNGQMNDGV